MTVRATAGRARRIVGDLARILAGRRDGAGRRSLGASIADARAYLAMIRAEQRGDLRDALDRATDLLALRPRLRGALRVASDIGMRRGGLIDPLDATRRLRALADSPALRTRERVLEGRLAETADGWLPRIPRPAHAIEPRASTVVMHLLKASLPERQSGYTIRSRATLRAQREAGLEPFAVTPYGYPSTTAPGVDAVDGIPHHRICPGCPTDEVRSDEALVRTATAAADIAVRERPALIQAASGFRGYELALVGAALREHLHRPFVYEVRGFLESAWTSDPELADAAEWSRRRHAAEARALAAADGVTTLSAAMREELISRGVAAERIVVVPNGIDPDEFTPTPPDPNLRRRYGLEGRWVFGYVSNMDHAREGQELLIEAAARLVRAGRPVTCLLVGDGSRRVALEAQAAATGIPGAVVFTGRVPHAEVAAHYALLDAFVVPRLPDRAARFTTPLKPYEAMAMGRPLVVADLPALTEIAAPGERGLAFAHGDVADLVATLERLIDRPHIASRIGAAGREWVLAERTWAADGARYRDFYAEVLARFSSPISDR